MCQLLAAESLRVLWRVAIAIFEYKRIVHWYAWRWHMPCVLCMWCLRTACVVCCSIAPCTSAGLHCHSSCHTWCTAHPVASAVHRGVHCTLPHSAVHHTLPHPAVHCTLPHHCFNTLFAAGSPPPNSHVTLKTMIEQMAALLLISTWPHPVQAAGMLVLSSQRCCPRSGCARVGLHQR